MSRLRLFVPLLVFAALAVLLFRGLSLDPNYMPSALEDRALPPFSAQTLDGRAVSDKDLGGQAALLNVWATWCPSCHAEHAYLNELARQGVAIYGINYKDDAAAARRWLAERGDPYRFSVIDANGRIGLDLGVTGAPETYVLDARGVVRLRLQGPIDEQIWKTRVQPLLQEIAAGSPG